MTLRTLLDRRVSIIPRTITGRDARGNDVVTDGDPVDDVPAARDLLTAAEDTGDDREQTSTRWLYFFDAGTDLGALYRIVDDGETLELEGEPERLTRRRGGREHHVEAVAYRTVG